MMLTKKEYAKLIIADFVRDNNPPETLSGVSIPDEIISSLSEADISRYCFMSSTFAVAAEFLGLITDLSVLMYVKDRGGIIATYIEKTPKFMCNMLTVREMLDLLPESIDSEGDGKCKC